MARREFSLLSVRAGQSLLMHSVSNTRLLSPLTGKKKYHKFIAKYVTVLRQTVHNLQTGTFKAKGIDQQKRYEKVFVTVLYPPKKQFIRADGVGWTHYTHSSSPNPHVGPLCYKKT